MIGARHIFAFVAMLALGGCPPQQQPVSLYNNSGQQLTLDIPQAEDLIWKPGEYLTFDPTARFPNQKPDAVYRIEWTKADGEKLRFGERDDAMYGRWFEGSGPYGALPRISVEPQYACDHLRLEPDLNIYLIGSRYTKGSGCGKIKLDSLPVPGQPIGFPLYGGDPPAPEIDGRTIHLGK